MLNLAREPSICGSGELRRSVDVRRFMLVCRFTAVVLLAPGLAPHTVSALATEAGANAAAATPIPENRDDETVTRLPVVFHTADSIEDRLLESWLAKANGPFAAAGVRFELAGRRALPGESQRLQSNRDRHRLKRFLRRRVINVFVVDEIRDPWPSAATRRAALRVGREPTGYLGGAHIPAPGRTPATYVIVLRRAIAYGALTHELGHFLGAPHHRDPRNIMSYGVRRDRFDDRQLAMFRRRARRLVRTRKLRYGEPAAAGAIDRSPVVGVEPLEGEPVDGAAAAGEAVIDDSATMDDEPGSSSEV